MPIKKDKNSTIETPIGSQGGHGIEKELDVPKFDIDRSVDAVTEKSDKTDKTEK